MSGSVLQWIVRFIVLNITIRTSEEIVPSYYHHAITPLSLIDNTMYEPSSSSCKEMSQ